MAAILIYLIKWAILLALGVALFMLLMRGETFHRFNRWLLLAIASFSMVLPAVNFSIDSPMARFSSVIEQLVVGDAVVNSEVSIMIEEPLAQMLVADNVSEDGVTLWQHITSLGALEWGLIVYAVVALLLVVRLLYMYVRIVAILRSGVRDDISSYVVGSRARLFVHNADYKPFSWFGWVSISRADLDECGREILTHEYAHVQCGHSYDILFADLIIILQWFNPMAWIMKGLLKDIHEYEADSAVLTAGVDAKSYQLLIIKKAVGARLYSIANSFNHSLTKKRITMMYKEKSSLWRCTKALYIVPLAVLAACSFSSPKSEAEDKGNEKIVNTATNGEISNLDVQVARDEKEVAEVLIALKEPEVAAEYPGGTPALMRFLSTKVKYPKEAEKRGEQGKAYVKFVVMSDGNVDYVRIAKSSGSKTLDDEAVRVVKSMPRWTPAKHNGENVNSELTLPVAFKLGGVPTVSVSAPEGEKEVVKEPEVAAEYPGGTPALMRFLSMKVKYPKEAEKRGEQGKAYVKFVVKSDGNVDYVQIAKSSGSKTLDDEAMRVVKSMPRWTPAKHNGENVYSMLTLPVVFKLGDVPTVSVSAPEGEKEVADVKIALVDEEIYQVVEQIPEFKGGMQALMKYLTSNINYPQEAKDKNIQGRSLIGFVVEKDGSITDVEVARSSGNDLLDQESVRVVKSMPKWNPGKQKGKVVRTRFVLPVMFRLQ